MNFTALHSTRYGCTALHCHGLYYSLHYFSNSISAQESSALWTVHRSTPGSDRVTVNCTLYIVHCTVHCTLYTVHTTLYTVHCALYTVHCKLYTVHCTLYTALYTVQNGGYRPKPPHYKGLGRVYCED